MVMIPSSLRDPPPDSRQSSTARPVSARMVRPQRRYASNLNISFEYEPPPVPKLGVPPPESTSPESTFDKWRAAAAELDPHGEGAGGPGEAQYAGAAAPLRRTLHDVLFGTTAVLLVGVLGGIGYLVWSGAVPGVVAPGGTAPKGSSFAAVVQPLVDLAAKTPPRASPNHPLPPPPTEEAAVSVLTPPPAAPLSPRSTTPDRLALAAPSADGPALAGPPPPAEPIPWAKSSELEAAAPTPAMPSAPAEVASLPAPVPAPELTTAVVAPPAKVAVPDAALPTPAAPPATPEPTTEQAAAKAVPPAKQPEPDAAHWVPPVVSVTVRLPPALEWTPPAALASLPEAAALPAPPATLSAPPPSAEPTAAPVAMAKGVPFGIRQQMPPPMHDEILRSRIEMAAQARAARVIAWKLKLAETRNAAAARLDAGGPQARLPTSAVVSDGGSLRTATTVPQQVLRGYRVQKGSPDAAVLSAGPEQADQRLVMVGDQLPGVGRVLAILPRGESWIVRTERGVIR